MALWVVSVETDEVAERLASSADMAFALLNQGRLIRVPPVEEALRFLDSQRNGHSGRSPLPVRARRRIVGGPETVKAGIKAAAREYAADEVMVVTITHDHAARRRSYELIAKAFELNQPLADTATATAPALRGYAGIRTFGASPPDEQSIRSTPPAP